MSVVAWIFLGLMAEFMASNIVRSSGQGLLLTSCSASLARWPAIFAAIGASGLTRFDLYSMPIIGAAVVLWLYHALSGRSV